MWMTRRNFTLIATMSAAAQPALSRGRSGVVTTVDQESEQGTLPRLEFRHVDVFSKELLSGNGLIVFASEHEVRPGMMQALTREMRQFESIFLKSTADPNVVKARVFTMEEELDFAGHPLLGAAAVLHQQRSPERQTASWTIELRQKTVPIVTTREKSWYRANMNQGTAEFGRTLSIEESRPFLQALNLKVMQIPQSLHLQQVSTGLPYLIVPISHGLENARIVQPGFESLLATVGAKFVYVLDVNRREGRTWDNQGLVEDVATGSAAGPAGAYLVRQKLLQPGQELVLKQGRFVGRPSLLFVTVQDRGNGRLDVSVAGDVRLVARGQLGA
jgi:trans-2,3-dihydro-3-hydroxyanthranilate isomerase